jgi:phosphogluconate dehydratase
MLEKINLIKNRIQDRSNGSRTAYLKNIEFWKQNSPNRNSLGCSNLAHTYAACNNKTPAESLNIKKFIGIITAYNDMLSAHAPLEAYPGQLKNQADKLNLHIQVAGGVPAMCDGITQGEPGMELSLFSRDAIALSTAIGLSHNVFDAAICMGTCDKIVPGLLIGALKFGHLPVIFIPGGPMATGISNAKKSETRQSYAAGEIEKIDLLAIEQQAYHSEGTCTFYGTANTNQLIAEAMGFQLPGAAFTPTDSPIRDSLNQESLKSLMKLMDAELGLGEMLDLKNWINAIIVLLASGGSTNLVIHLIAMARSAGYIIEIEDFNDLSQIIPLLCQIYPNGNADVNEFHAEGGIARLLTNLIDGDLIYEDIQTVAGLGLSNYTKVPFIESSSDNTLRWANLERNTKPLISIATSESPFKTNGGIKFIGGDIAEGVIKVSALKDENGVIRAPAKVFLSQEAVLKAFEGDELNQDVILVLLGQSPAMNGMPELHKLTSPINVLQKRGYNIALVTDGRMSGASGSFPALIHAVSENGNLYKIRTGDMLTLDLEKAKLTIEDQNLENRESIQISPSNHGLGRELFKIFRDNVSSVKLGATIFND